MASSSSRSPSRAPLRTQNPCGMLPRIKMQLSEAIDACMALPPLRRRLRCRHRHLPLARRSLMLCTAQFQSQQCGLKSDHLSVSFCRPLLGLARASQNSRRKDAVVADPSTRPRRRLNASDPPFGYRGSAQTQLFMIYLARPIASSIFSRRGRPAAAAAYFTHRISPIAKLSIPKHSGLPPAP